MKDQELLGDVQDALLEPRNEGVFVTTPLWTIAELVQYANDRQRHFLDQTGLIAASVKLVTRAAEGRYELGSDYLSIRRVAFEDETGAIRELPPVDAWMADHAVALWGRERARPQTYLETNLPDGKIDLLPPPRDIGQLHLLLITLGTTLSNTGIALTVPDDFAAYVKWGILADALKKAGPAHDPARAEYAEERFDEGILLAQVLMGHENA